MISSWMVWAPVVPVVAFAMEHWARMMHGRVWHRWLWRMHRSHHAPRRGRFEANDLLSSSHSFFAAGLIVYGFEGTPGLLRELGFGVGVGMTVFGLAYLAVHDGFVHGRLPLAWLDRFAYFRAVREAHKEHHRRGHAAPFGLFMGPWELGRESKAAQSKPAQRSRELKERRV